MNGNETEPWERRTGESGPAFAAFSEYCEMGDARSIRSVAAKIGKSTTLIGGWSSRHEWVERARAYDNHLCRQRTARARAEQRRMDKRHIDIADKLQRRALDALDALDPDAVETRDIIEMLRLATELERMSRRCEILDGYPDDVHAMAALRQKQREHEHRMQMDNARLEREKQMDDADGTNWGTLVEAAYNYSAAREDYEQEPNDDEI